MTRTASMLLVTDHEALPPAQKVWGTGGWVMPDEREALDWLTLAKLGGWGVTVATLNLENLIAERLSSYHWIVVACDPEVISEELVAFFRSWLVEHPVALISRGTTAGTPMSMLADTYESSNKVEGRSIQRVGVDCRSWQCRKAFEAKRLEIGSAALPWASINGNPVISERHFGRGAIYTLGFHPSAERDKNGTTTALLRDLLVAGCRHALAWLDFSHTMVLRMDDPGTAQNVYLRSWAYAELDEKQWIEIGEILRQYSARLSVGYASGWVDDGNDARGSLLVNGHAEERVPGRVHDAPLVVYHDKNGTLPGTLHDFSGEYRAICALHKQGLVDIELHGYTHMHPDSAKWAGSDDRYEATHWYRELGNHALPAIAQQPLADHPINRGVRAIRHYFGVLPTALISPGDEWTNEALEIAIEAGLSLVSSYYLALRHGDHLCWSQHVCAPYLDQPDDQWFDSGLPIVGYFHDREPSIYGPAWITDMLDNWIERGAKRFLSFRDLADQLNFEFEVRQVEQRLQVYVNGYTVKPNMAPVRLVLHVPDSMNNCQIEFKYEGPPLLASIHWIDSTTALAILKDA